MVTSAVSSSLTTRNQIPPTKGAKPASSHFLSSTTVKTVPTTGPPALELRPHLDRELIKKAGPSIVHLVILKVRSHLSSELPERHPDVLGDRVLAASFYEVAPLIEQPEVRLQEHLPKLEAGVHWEAPLAGLQSELE